MNKMCRRCVYEIIFIVILWPKKVRRKRFVQLMWLAFVIYIIFVYITLKSQLKNTEINIPVPYRLNGSYQMKPSEKTVQIMSSRIQNKGCLLDVPDFTKLTNGGCHWINVSYWSTHSSRPIKAFVYSAFHDERKRMVKLIAVANGDLKGAYCQIWFTQGADVTVLVSKAVPVIIPETHDYRFVVYMIYCKLARSRLTPTFVSVVPEKCKQPDHVLPITRKRRKPFKPTFNFTVCVSPIHSQYINIGEFVEFIEVNEMFGADHFIFYNHSIGESLTPLLRTYIDEGKLTLLDWHIPIEIAQGPTNQIHYFGQLAALNDCVYRARTTSKYVVLLDLDEFITPMEYNTWLELLNNINQTSKYASFQIRNVFFPKQLPKSRHRMTVIERLQTLSLTKREKRIWPHHIRSKYIADPNKLVIAGVHYAWEMAGNFVEYLVQPEKALLFHYRELESPTSLVQEKRMLQFKDSIIRRIRHRLSTVNIL